MSMLSRVAGTASRLFVVCALTSIFAATSGADPFPPEFANCGVPGSSCHFAPAAWPAEPANAADCGVNCGDWQPYTRFQGSVNDPRVQDPSNGGTRPQNYVNIASSCSDTTQPSIYYSLEKGAALDGSEDVIMFRWRVEQIAHTYATGPSPGSFGATDPWNAALWTVLFDVDGDGFRDLAAHLDGSSGGPATPVDMIAGIWGDIPTQSIDYNDDPSIHRIAHNPTAFVDTGTGRILNFQNSLTPSTDWPNGSAETIWDHGTTRARLVSTSSCNEYFIDYQIPVAMLDASSLGGPSIDRDTPISMLFCTANSLNNPFQKDCAINRDWAASSTKEAPFGDYTSFDQGEFEQPIVDEIEAKGCGVFDLDAKVKDTIAIVDGEAVRTVQSVDYYYYRDDDGNGLADDGNTWQLAVNGTPDASPINAWSATWDATGLLNGQYLLGVQALDDPDQALYDDGTTSDGIANRTFSYLTQAEVDAAGPPPAGENWYANPSATGVQSLAVAVNACGIPTPWVEKTVAQPSGVTGGTASYTITVHNTLDTLLAVDSITDHLPDGFSFVSTDGGTLTPDTSPANGNTGDVQWTFSPAASIAAGSTGSIDLTVQLPAVTGTFQNTASAATDFSTAPIESDPAAIEVGAPRLSIAKSATPLSTAAGDPVSFTITYANASPVGVTGTTITDALPEGLTYVSGTATGGGVFDGGTNTITWDIGALASGSGSASVSFDATVTDPFPATASVPVTNTATIDSDQTSPASDSASIFVDVPRPRLTLEKSADTPLVDPGANVTFTLRYANTGSGDAGDVVLTDTIPAGFSFVSATGTGVESGGTVTWNIGTLAAGASGSVSLTLQADATFTASNPALNQASIDSGQTDPVEADLEVGVTQSGQFCETYYFKDEVVNVGTDGTQRIANLVAVQAGDVGTSQVFTAPVSTEPFLEALRFYQEPPSSNEIDFTGTIDTSFWFTRPAGGGVDVQATVYEYNDATGIVNTLGSGISGFSGGSLTAEFTFSVDVTSTTLGSGNRLLWIYEIRSQQSNQTREFELLFDGDVTSQLTASSVFADSRSSFCTTPPARLIVQKSADTASVIPGETFNYTIDFANIGETDATNSVITDTLPDGVTFNSATLNGGTSVTPTVSGNDYSFTVNSSTGAAGTIAGGDTGTLVIEVTVDDPLDAGTRELVNLASLASDQTQPVTDGSVTPVEGVDAPGEPQLVVEKGVDSGTLRPGETAGYTITVLNAGTADANNVAVTDDVPDTAYYGYAPGSISGGDAADDSNAGSLAWTINTLAPGASVTLGFDMTADVSGVPSGTTFLDNQAEAGRDGLAGTVSSNVVSVAIKASPALAIQKTVDPAPLSGFWEPGDTFEYTLNISNQGGADAEAVSVSDPIPDNTAFEAVTQGTGAFDPATNRVRFDLGTLAPDANATAAFRVRVTDPLPGDQAVIDNSAVASASNAASVEDAAATTAEAVPVMTLQKTGPSVLPFPATSVSQAASASAVITVDDVQLLSLGDAIRVAGQVATIVNIGASTLTLDQPVTVAAGDAVDVAGTYALTWRNTGTGTATNVQVADTLPASFEFHAASPAPSSAPSGTGGTVVWNLGAVGPGASGTLELTVFPTIAGAFTNSATLSADNLGSDVTDTADTEVGGLAIGKSTTTPVSAAGGTATYVLAVENTLPTEVAGVTVMDVLPPGFTFNAGTPVIIGGTGVTRDPVVDPADGEAFPAWGEFTIPGGETLTITFEVDIDGSVGPATYQNDILVEADGAVSLPFDPLGTTEEDVTVLGPDTGVVEGYVYRDDDADGAFGPGDAPLTGVAVEILDADSTLFIEPTDSSGFFRRVVAAGTVDLDVGGAADDGIPATLVLASGSTDPASVSVPDGGVTRHDTGYVPEGSVQDGVITGHVFLDADGDGVLDTGEVGFASAAVTVVTSLGDTLVVNTDTAGNFSLTVPEGNTDLTYTTPSGYELTTGNDSQTVPVPGNDTASADDVGYTRQTGTVSGHVFLDDDGDGVVDSGESGLASVAVTILTSDGDTLNVLTDSAGNFSVTVPEGTTQLTYATPSGHVVTTANATQNVSVPVDGNGAAGDVGYQPVSVPHGTLAGHVFVDGNGNTVQDAGEPDLAGVPVTLDTSDGGSVNATTDPSGDFQVSVPEGTTLLAATGPAGYSLTTGNGSQFVDVLAEATVQAEDIGYRPAEGTDTGELSALVFLDANGNGARDSGEALFSGVRVLVGMTGGIQQSLLTGPDGMVQVVAPSGTADVEVVGPAGYQLTTANDLQSVPVPVGGAVGADDIGYQAAPAASPGVVAGTVFEDANRNGAMDPDETGMADVTVTVTTSGGDILVAVTDGNGDYSLTIPSGTTGIAVSDPAGYELTTANRDQTAGVSAGATARAGNVGYAVAGAVLAIPALGPTGLALLLILFAAAGRRPFLGAARRP